MSSRIRILGIDPGSRITGFGVIDVDGAGNHASSIDHGVVKTTGEHSARLRMIFSELARIVGDYAPDEISIESVFVHRNADSALKLGQARAAALCATFAAELPIYEYAPRQIKKAVAGTGKAEKDQVQHMVRLILGLHDELPADAADALAIALCHAHSRSARATVHHALGLA